MSRSSPAVTCSPSALRTPACMSSTPPAARRCSAGPRSSGRPDGSVRTAASSPFSTERARLPCSSRPPARSYSAPVVQVRELRNVFFTRNGTELLVDAVTSIISVRMDGREPLASAPFGKPDDFPGAVRSDGEIVWAFPSALELAARPRATVESAAYRPSDGEVVQTVPGHGTLLWPGGRLDLCCFRHGR